MRRHPPLWALTVPAAAIALLAGCGHSSTASPSSSGSPGTVSTSVTEPQSSPTATDVCANADVSTAVKAALVTADGRPGATEVSGATFYGTCGSSAYAVTAMTLAAGGTDAQSVAFDDQGSFPELFVDTGAGWKLVTRSDTPMGCTSSGTLPAALRSIWHDCAVAAPSSVAPTQASAAPVSCEQHYAGKVFVLAKAVTLGTDGSAVLTGAPVTVHCGGPDDFQFNAQSGTTTVDIAPHAAITVVGPTTMSSPLALSKLPAYVQKGFESDVFLLTGVADGSVFHATAIAEQFHP